MTAPVKMAKTTMKPRPCARLRGPVTMLLLLLLLLLCPLLALWRALMLLGRPLLVLVLLLHSLVPKRVPRLKPLCYVCVCVCEGENDCGGV